MISKKLYQANYPLTYLDIKKDQTDVLAGMLTGGHTQATKGSSFCPPGGIFPAGIQVEKV